MARQKNSTALFDAIYSAKKPPKPSPSAAIPTPKWWGKNKTLPKPPVPESTENVGRQRSWLAAAKKTAATPSPAAAPMALEPAASQSVVEESARMIDQAREVESVESGSPVISGSTVESTVDSNINTPKPRFIDRFVNRAPKSEPIAEAVTEPELGSGSGSDIVEQTDNEPMSVETITNPASNEVAVNPGQHSSNSPRRRRNSFVTMDSGAREFRFQLSYLGLVAIGFIFVMLLAIAFIFGTRINSLASNEGDSLMSSKEPTTAPSTGLLAAVGPEAPVVDITPAQPIKPDVLSIPKHPVRNTVADPSTPVTPPLPIKSTRDIGMMYVLVQSYPEHDLAQKACDYMNHAGIACTLVQGPSHWAMDDWYSVIGLQPFNKHDPALPGYERTIKALGVKFTNRAIDQFQPQAYTWREDSDLSQ